MRFEEIREKIVNNPGFRTLREIKEAGYRIVKERDGDRYFLIKPEELRSLLVRLGDVAEVRFGIKTGANKFFYLEPVELTVAEVMKLSERDPRALVRVKNGAGWEGEIEAEFLKPVIKSPRECRTILLKPEDLRYLVFMCRKSKKELKGTKALEYIQWGEKRGYHRRPTCRSRPKWWDLGIWKVPDGILPAGLNDIFRFFVNNRNILADKRMYLFYGVHEILLFMNSTLYLLFLELGSRTGLGEGLLDLTVYEYKNVMVMPYVFKNGRKDYIQSENVEKLKSTLAPFLNRPIQSIFTECGIDPESGVPISEQEPKPLPDRKALDDLVFDVLGLTDEERKEVYRAICQLVWERISRARSVRRR